MVQQASSLTGVILWGFSAVWVVPDSCEQGVSMSFPRLFLMVFSLQFSPKGTFGKRPWYTLSLLCCGWYCISGLQGVDILPSKYRNDRSSRHMVQVDASLILKPPLGQFFLEKLAYRKVLEMICTDLHHWRNFVGDQTEDWYPVVNGPNIHQKIFLMKQLS